jgi:hypothetical protein
VFAPAISRETSDLPFDPVQTAKELPAERCGGSVDESEDNIFTWSEHQPVADALGERRQGGRQKRATFGGGWRQGHELRLAEKVRATMT